MIDLTSYGLHLAALLFVIGLFIMITKKNIIFVLIGVEVILNAALLNMVVFSAKDPGHQGETMGIFIVVVAACEAAVGLAILLNLYKRYKSSDLGDFNALGR